MTCQVIERSYTTPETETQHRLKFPDHWERYEFAASYSSGLKVLDVACGCGYGTALISKKSGKKASGFDIDLHAVTWAIKHYADQAEFSLIQNYPWSVEDNSFDMVVSLETIEHVKDPIQFLQEVNRVLKSNGILILSTPRNESSERFNPANPFHLREYSLSELESLVSEYFTIQSRWSQISNFSREWSKIKTSKWGQFVLTSKKIFPRGFVAYIKTLITGSNRAKSGSIIKGQQDGANVQIVIAQKNN